MLIKLLNKVLIFLLGFTLFLYVSHRLMGSYISVEPLLGEMNFKNHEQLTAQVEVKSASNYKFVMRFNKQEFDRLGFNDKLPALRANYKNKETQQKVAPSIFFLEVEDNKSHNEIFHTFVSYQCEKEFCLGSKSLFLSEGVHQLKFKLKTDYKGAHQPVFKLNINRAHRGTEEPGSLIRLISFTFNLLWIMLLVLPLFLILKLCSMLHALYISINKKR